MKACDWLDNYHLVEVLVVCPDALVGGLPPPAPVLGVMPHDVDDASGRIQRLVDAKGGHKIRIKCVYTQRKRTKWNGQRKRRKEKGY